MQKKLIQINMLTIKAKKKTAQCRRYIINKKKRL